MTATIIQQGSFTSTGESVELQIRSDVDWMHVRNDTQWATTQNPGRGVQFGWQRSLAPGEAWETFKTNSANTLEGTKLSSGGFTLLDTSLSPLDTLNSTLTAISTAAIPVATNSGVNGLVAGDIVRFTNVLSAQQLGGFDFTIGNNTLTNTTFSLDYMSQLGLAGTTGSWRRIKFDAQFYPRRRDITAITQATSAVITLSVTHGFTAGQAVRVIVPDVYGMSEINNIIGNITAVNTSLNTITVDIDSNSFTAFAFPVTGDVPFSRATIVPVGETADGTFANNLDDATDNQSFIGMKLGAGPRAPAGSNADVIYWKAGKSSLISTL